MNTVADLKISMFTRLLSACMAAASLSMTVSCGGGGGNSPTGPGHTTGQVPDAQPDAPSPGDTITPRTSPGPSAERVLDYLLWHASGGPWEGCCGPYQHDPGLVRFTSTPTVRLATGMTGRERASALYAVGLVNRALPYDRHLRIGPNAPSVVARTGGDLAGRVPDGQIFIEFHRDQASGRASPGVAHQDVSTVYDDQQGRWEKKHLRAAQVEIDGEFFDDKPDWQLVSVVVHELLHSLGLQGHPDDEFSDSTMYNAWFRLDGSLTAIDAAGILALYTRLPAASEPEDLSVTSLGEWEEEATNLTRSFSAVSFGVRHANGVTMPWTMGQEPTRALSENQQIRGTVTWNGDLIGYTPDLDAVQGDAMVSVDLGTMNGRADFIDLETGDGATWSTGNLGYTITVGGNYLRSTGGDAGTVNGQFYGASHEGVGGSVERTDLTAAFGATR